jgi:hypothetical protein
VIASGEGVSQLSRFLVFLLLVSSVIKVDAQFETADVLGSVHDPSNAAVSAAVIVLLNQDTGIEAKTKTDEAGEFTFSNVKVGRYTVSAEAPGFAKAVAADIRVDVNARSGRRGCRARNGFERTRAGDPHATDRGITFERPRLLRPRFAFY